MKASDLLSSFLSVYPVLGICVTFSAPQCTWVLLNALISLGFSVAFPPWLYAICCVSPAILCYRQLWVFHGLTVFYLFIYLAAPGLSCSTWDLCCRYRIFSCSMQDLVPWPGIEPGPSAFGVLSLNHWTIREVPYSLLEQFLCFSVGSEQGKTDEHLCQPSR